MKKQNYVSIRKIICISIIIISVNFGICELALAVNSFQPWIQMILIGARNDQECGFYPQHKIAPKVEEVRAHLMNAGQISVIQI